MTDLMRGPCMCGKDKGSDSLAFPLLASIRQAFFFSNKRGRGGGDPHLLIHSMKVSLQRSIPGIPGLDYRGVDQAGLATAGPARLLPHRARASRRARK